MKWLTHSKGLLLGFGAASLLMAVVNLISYQNATQLIESTNQSQQTYEIIKNLADVLTDMAITESGRRGYIFLDDQSERSRYKHSVEKMNGELQALDQQVANNSLQRLRLKKLRQLIDRRLELFEQSMQLYERDRTAIAQQSQITMNSLQVRDQIEASIAEMQDQEQAELHQWLNHSQANIHHRIWIEFLITCSSFAILVIACLILYRQLVRRQEAEALSKALEREAELSTLKLRFFSMVSHEFRTPLSIILGSAQMLAENNPNWTSDRRLKTVRRIQSAAQLMTHHLGDILTLTRAEAGKLDCNPQPLDVEAFCLNLLEDLQVSESSHHFAFRSHNGCGLVNLDEKLLFSILSNLLLNAVKYSASGSTIQLNLQQETDGIWFEVTDTGIGMNATDQSRLYTPFHRGENVANVDGIGLGLVVVQKCVERHGGKITVQSEVDVGTTFRVWLPFVNSHASSTIAP